MEYAELHVSIWSTYIYYNGFNLKIGQCYCYTCRATHFKYNDVLDFNILSCMPNWEFFLKMG